MRLRILILGICFSAFSISAQNPAKRDLQALAVLQQSFAVMGAAVPEDSILTGRITREAGGTTEAGTVRILTRGFDQTVEHVKFPDRDESVTYSRGFAKRQERGNGRELQLELAVASQSSAVPLFLIAAALADTDTTVEYRGLEQSAGSTAHRIRFWKTFSSNPKLKHLTEFAAREIWVDSVSSLPVRLAYEHREGRGSADRFRYEVSYSDYRNVGGALYPFRVERNLNGTPWETIQIDRVILQNGLSSSDFAIR